MTAPRVALSDIERLLSKCVVRSEGCWLWTGGVAGGTGYGIFTLGGRKVGAHRASYLLHVGPIPDGHHIDHICRTRTCVRPDHLRTLTQADNNRHRGPSKRGTSGHRGVSWNKRAKKWRAMVRNNGRMMHLGYFVTLEDAAAAAEAARIELWGVEIGSERTAVTS